MTDPPGSGDGEVWKPFPGSDPIYLVSNLGRVWSIPRKVPDTRGRMQSKGGIFLAMIEAPGGYHRVTALVNGKQKPLSVHRAVCEAFHGPPPTDRHVVAHGNGDPTDNRAENLRWATYSENAIDTVRHGRNPWSRRSHCAKGHPFSGGNLIVTKRGRRRCRICTTEAQRRADAKRRPRKSRGKDSKSPITQ